jgi:hypothetical protein
MAAQGSLIVFVVMLFVFAYQKDKIDRDWMRGYQQLPSMEEMMAMMKAKNKVKRLLLPLLTTISAAWCRPSTPGR